MSEQKNCYLCDRPNSSLVEGACPNCRAIYFSVTVEAEQDGATSPYISALTARVQEILREVLELPDRDTMKHIIKEALHQHHLYAARDPSAVLQIGVLGYVSDDSHPLTLSPTDQEPQ